MKPRKVLVVDDNKSTLKVIKAILSQEGYTVYTASSPEEGMGILKSFFQAEDGIRDKAT